jgi:cytochrome c oxidase accessory protein FixG
MFNWIERRIEGTHHQSKALDQSPLSLSKATKRVIKHTLWLVVSLFTALVFISYFVPANELYESFFTLTASSLTQGWVYFFLFCTYINGGWVKEKMCLHICPYARFQSVMFDKSTTLMTYDTTRGESRGPRQRTKAKPHNKGDCVDCDLCVQVCPVGIDIRNGLQYECINCGLCADACDSVMEKFSYAKGLIKYTSQAPAKSYWKQHVGYGLVISLFSLSAIAWGITRDTFEVSVLRDRQVLYRVTPDGKAENTYTFKTLNKSQFLRTFNLVVEQPEAYTIKGDTVFTIQPGEHYMNIVSVVSNSDLTDTTNHIRFIITEQASQETSAQRSVFYSGNDTW